MRLRDRLRLALTGRKWNGGWGGDQMLGWEYLDFRSEAEYRAWDPRSRTHRDLPHE